MAVVSRGVPYVYIYIHSYSIYTYTHNWGYHINKDDLECSSDQSAKVFGCPDFIQSFEIRNLVLILLGPSSQSSRTSFVV